MTGLAGAFLRHATGSDRYWAWCNVCRADVWWECIPVPKPGTTVSRIGWQKVYKCECCAKERVWRQR